MYKVFRWLFLLFSDDPKVSSRRFIALQAFYLIVVTLIISLIKGSVKLENLQIIGQIELHLFYITLLGVFGVTATDLVKIIKNSATSFEEVEEEPLDESNKPLN